MRYAPILRQSPATVAKLKALPYYAYLKTPYWKAVAAWMKTKYARCQYPACQVASYRCEVHHDITRDAYAYRGEESEYHLKVLCPRHHDKAHRRKGPGKKTKVAGIGRMVKTLYHIVLPPAPDLLEQDLLTIEDALTCYADHLIREKVDKKAPDLYGDVAKTQLRFARFMKAFHKSAKGQQFIIERK